MSSGHHHLPPGDISQDSRQWLSAWYSSYLGLPAEQLEQIPVASWRKPLWTLMRGRRSRKDTIQTVPPEGKLSLRDIHPLKPLLMLLEPDMAMLLFFNGVVYTAYYCATGSLSSLLDDLYGYSQTEIGLCFLAIGGGALGGEQCLISTDGS